jgi:hypothetical protein
MNTSAIEDDDQADQVSYLPDSALYYVEVESESGFAVDRLRDAGLPESGRSSIAAFRQLVGRLRLPEDAETPAIKSMTRRVAFFEAGFTHDLEHRQWMDP